MTIFQKIRQLLSGKKTNEVPESYCPNCWGRQEYEGAFLDAVRQEKIDLNNIDQKKGWIDAYAVRHFEGIKLRPVEDGVVCGACQTIYYKN
jgi:hypothetical protein